MNKNDIEQKIENGMLSLAENRFAETMAAIEQDQSQPTETVVPFTPKKTHIYPKVIAACILLCLCLTSVLQYETTTRRVLVTLDVNPGIAMKLNQKMNVKSIYGTNEDGTELLSHMNITKKTSFDEIVSSLITELENKNYLNDNSDILIGFKGKKETIVNNVQESVSNKIMSTLNEHSLSTVHVACCNFSGKAKASAKDQLVQDLITAQLITPEDASQLSVHELLAYSSKLANSSVAFITNEPTNYAEESTKQTAEASTQTTDTTDTQVANSASNQDADNTNPQDTSEDATNTELTDTKNTPTEDIADTNPTPTDSANQTNSQSPDSSDDVISDSADTIDEAAADNKQSEKKKGSKKGSTKKKANKKKNNNNKKKTNKKKKNNNSDNKKDNDTTKSKKSNNKKTTESKKTDSDASDTSESENSKTDNRIVPDESSNETDSSVNDNTPNK